MLNRLFIPTATVAAAIAGLTPSAATAQSFSVYGGSGYQRYDDDERREAWIARRHWEQREQWEREQARRQYWARERWDRDHADRRYRDDDRRDWRGWREDDDE